MVHEARFYEPFLFLYFKIYYFYSTKQLTNTLITPINSVFLTLDSALQDEIILGNGLKLYYAADFDVEWNATVTGIVAGLPKHPTGQSADVVSKLKIGDEVAFSYRVVSDRGYPKAEDFFSPIIQGTPTFKKFTNSKGWKLSITALPPVHGKFNKIWVGLLTDRRNNHLDGCQGNEHEIDNWLSKFKFSGVQDMFFNNLIKVKKDDFWRCQFTEILAKKRKNKIIAINDRVICEPIEERVKERFELTSGVAMPFQDIKMRYIDRAKLISGGEELGFRTGDIVSFNPDFCECYSLWGNNYYLIKKRHLNGRWL